MATRYLRDLVSLDKDAAGEGIQGGEEYDGGELSAVRFAGNEVGGFGRDEDCKAGR